EESARRTPRTARQASAPRGPPRSGAAPSSTGSAPCPSGAAPRNARERRGTAAGPRRGAPSGRGRSPRAGSRGAPGSTPRGRASCRAATPVRGLYRCLDCPATMSPRYDVPKAAPEPLRQVQQFLNSIDLEDEVDWLPGWLDERGLGSELERAQALRVALRGL